MNDSARMAVKYSAWASLTGLVSGALGLFGQTVVLAAGGQESPALITAFGSLASASVVGLGTLAGILVARGSKDEK